MHVEQRDSRTPRASTRAPIGARIAAPVLATILLLGCGSGSDAARAYLDGRYQEALDEYAVAERALGPRASAALLHNQALAALRAGRPRQGEAAAEKAAVRGGVAFYPVRDFLRANAAHARSERAEAAAELQDAEPGAWKSAIDEATTARRLWIAALEARADWPEARRNIERMNARIDRLEQKKAEAEQKQRRDPKKPDPEPPPPDEPPPGGEQDPVGPEPELQTGELSADQVAQLFERLAAKERAKLASRTRQRAEQGARAERDW